MALARVIPILLLKGSGLYKTVQFDKATYVGDPINAVRIFNDKECDEIVVLDIQASTAGSGINLPLLEDIAGEAFMPLCYGGGVRSLDDLRRLFDVGIEKVSINTRAVENPDLVAESARRWGSQSIVVSIDVRRSRPGKYRVVTGGGRNDTGLDPVEHAVASEQRGAGEILLTSVDREGTAKGYDLDLTRRVSEAVRVPVIAHGGAGDLGDVAEVLRSGCADAAAAGSLFVFQGPHRAVLISYPTPQERAAVLEAPVEG